MRCQNYVGDIFISSGSDFFGIVLPEANFEMGQIHLKSSTTTMKGMASTRGLILFFLKQNRNRSNNCGRLRGPYHDLFLTNASTIMASSVPPPNGTLGRSRAPLFQSFCSGSPSKWCHKSYLRARARRCSSQASPPPLFFPPVQCPFTSHNPSKYKLLN